MLRKSEVLAGPGCLEPVRQETDPGSVYTLVPAHGESRISAIQAPLVRAWSEDLGLSVLLADFDSSHSSLWQPISELRSLSSFTRGALVRRERSMEVLNAAAATFQEVRPWIECVRRRYDVVVADLSPVSEEIGLEVMRASTSIFIVSDSDRASLDLVRDKAAWIRSHGLEDLCALLLRAAPGGMRADVAED